MAGAFQINVDVERNLITVTMAGFFSIEEVSLFQRARDAAHRQLRCGRNEHLTLVDIREMQIQSQEAVTEFSHMLSMPNLQSTRIAFVVSKSLARLQVQRAAANRDGCCFTDDIEYAKHWLITSASHANCS